MATSLFFFFFLQELDLQRQQAKNDAALCENKVMLRMYKFQIFDADLQRCLVSFALALVYFVKFCQLQFT